MTRLLVLILVFAMILGGAVTLASCAQGNVGDDGILNDSTSGSNEKVPETDDDLTGLGGKLEFVSPERPADAELPPPKVGEYTYKTYATSLGSNWNPHAWETGGDSAILDYITAPFVSIEPRDTTDGRYQWVGEMATAIKDVTAQRRELLSKYKVTLTEGKSADEVESGYVFEFTLNEAAKWQDGTPINADSYVYSMQQLLNPKMKNYRANLYISGEAAIAGGYDYYYSLDEGIFVSLSARGFDSIAEALGEGETLYIDAWSWWGLKGAVDAEGNECPRWLAYNDEHIYFDPSDGSATCGKYVWDETMKKYSAEFEVGAENNRYVAIYSANEGFGADWDTVGLIKNGEYSFLYVCDTAIEFNYFLSFCTDTWLVHEELYERGKREQAGLTVTDYCTSLDTTISYGAYKMTVFEDGKQVAYRQNESWYGYETTAEGALVSFTQFAVDGRYLQQYVTTAIVVDVMSRDVAKQKFFKGELATYSPSATELKDYRLSDRLQIVDETYTMSFFFNTDPSRLQALDASGKNECSVVLSNYSFRRAMSLAIDRADLVTASQAWTPAYSLMNQLYHYDIYNDPKSSYRGSEQAMQAIVDLYGVKYGDESIYATLKEAYDSITGYNLTEARALMRIAFGELVDSGLYTAGEDIRIQIGWSKGALTEDDNKQCALVQKYINAALEGSGFGKITLEPIGNIADRYGDTAAGLYAIGYGAWGGAAFYPFRNLQVYTDPDQYSLHEAGCWSPADELLTLSVNGSDVTMTWQAWGGSMIGTGVYANADNKLKLSITAQLEGAFLAKFYRIPLAATTGCTLVSYKVEDYADEYNVMYGFGGFRIMDYSFNDEEWAAYVLSQGGELNYK